MTSEEVMAHAARVMPSAAEFTRLEHATVGTLYMFFAIGGLATNLLTIVTLVKDKALFRGSTPWLHISLALANIGVVAPSPFPASSSFSGKWLYGDFMCQAYAFEGMFVGLAAIGCVISLCIERYVVSSRTEAMQQNSSAFYWLITSLNLANALFWAVMPILGWARYSLDHTGTTCALDWKHADEGFQSYLTTLFIFSFTLPMLFALVALYKAVPDTTGNPRTVTTSGVSASASSSSAATSCRQDSATSSFTESQLRWLCLSFVGLVLMGWGPFATLCLWATVADTSGVSMLAACLPPLACKACTSLYPLMYAVANPRFRAGYLSLLGLGVDPAPGSKAE